MAGSTNNLINNLWISCLWIKHREFRSWYFVLNGKAYSNNDIIQEGIFLCAEKIKSIFFSVDISLDLQTGKNIIVEIGDGQVSGLKQWSIQNFCSMFLNKF